jgi:hypothetical protein
MRYMKMSILEKINKEINEINSNILTVCQK